MVEVECFLKYIRGKIVLIEMMADFIYFKSSLLCTGIMQWLFNLLITNIK